MVDIKSLTWDVGHLEKKRKEKHELKKGGKWVWGTQWFYLAEAQSERREAWVMGGKGRCR